MMMSDAPAASADVRRSGRALAKIIVNQPPWIHVGLIVTDIRRRGIDLSQDAAC